MFNVSNRRTIALLSIRSLKSARLRNIAAICAIALTTVLFTTLFTLVIGTLNAFQQATMRQSGGSGHASIKYIDDITFENIKSHPLIKEISYNRILCDSVDNPELLKRRGEFWYMDDNGLKQGFCEPTEGTRPIAENEIIMDTKTLQLLNVPQEIGAPVKLIVTIRGQQVERGFILSGWWESDPAFNISMLITSKAYVDAHAGELTHTFKTDSSFSGVINAYIMFGNTWSMQKKLNRVITESGYSIYEDMPNYVASNLNWAYFAANSDPTATAAAAAVLVLIIFTGYLIIYNIFQISVLRDIRFYGLLKTIGATKRQIKRIIHLQATALSFIGIPIGLILGFMIGRGFVPLILAQSYFANSKAVVSANPLIFIGSSFFAALTVWISVRRPGVIAAKATPIEAVKYVDLDFIKGKKEKPSVDGGKLTKMAFSNLGRNKKRTALVLISLSLSFVLLNCVFTLSRGLDIEKYLSAFVDTDFLVAHADYFNYQYHGAENSVDEQVIAALEAQPGFKAGGRLYSTLREYFTIEDASSVKEYNLGTDGHHVAAVYGLDDLPLERLVVLEGELDIEKLKSGGYILEGVHTDDFSQPILDSARFAVGDKVVVHNHRIISLDPLEFEYTTQEYEVMAKVIIKYITNSDRRWNEYSFYLPANIYLPLTYEKAIMSYAFNAEEDYMTRMEAFMQDFTENSEPLMNYESKMVMVNEFNGLRDLLLSMGVILSAIIGLIGILNFVNSVITGIIARRREFAILQSIGMTRAQLRYMLCLEGFYYAAGTILLSLIFSVLSSLTVIKGLEGGLWFFSYHFTIIPIVVCWPFFIIISLLIPAAAFSTTVNKSVIDRLREE